MPSKGDMADLEAALDKRPNQVPLIDALQSTVAFQKRSQARSAQQPSATVGTNRSPRSNRAGARSQRQPGINIPLALG